MSGGEWCGASLLASALLAYFVVRVRTASASRILRDLRAWRTRRPPAASDEFARWIAEGDAILGECDRKAAAGDPTWNGIAATLRMELRQARLNQP
jgi:hypothetical protein